MRGEPGGIIALGFSPAAEAVLRQLEQGGLTTDIHRAWEGHGESGPWLAERWGSVSAVVAVGACGLVTRLIAPLLAGKACDPAVVVLDPHGCYAIPLLGGHGAGGEALAQRLAALLGGQAVLSGASGAAGRLALDAFGSAWGWRRGSGDWRALMVRAAGEGPPLVAQESGLALWRELPAATGLAFSAPAGIPGPADGADLVVSHQLGEGCRWHPPCLWIGLGCERDTSESLLERLLETTLRQHGLAVEAVAGLASATRKDDEPALLALAARRGWPLRFYEAERLAAVPVPTPSAVVARELGTPSVAEAAARLAAAEAGGTPATAAPLLVAKQIGRAEPGERGAATLAVALAPQQWAPARGALHLVGSGPGRLDALTGEARAALAAATVWVGYGLYLDLLEPLRRPDQLRRDGRLTEERQRCAEALALAEQGLTVALVSSGDSGIYGMAGLALELWLQRPRAERPAFAVHPGLSALQLAAARAGAPLMHDFCTISLSDRLTPWEVIERRLRAAAAGDFVVALYNPRSRDRDWQLERARDLLLEGRPASTPVVLARQLGRDGEQVSLHELGTLPIETVDMLTLVLVGNSSSRMQDDWMVTPRGYPGAELS
jgi:cobalt-precorrin 5A hydrolase/precorrin-3B C17-methyltransferase